MLKQNEPFQKGQFSLGLGGGGGPGGFGIGLNVGYMALDGLEVSLGGSYWVFDDTNLIRITPGVRYILVNRSSVMPYAGLFGRRWFFTDDTYEDVTSVGVRGGTYIRAATHCSRLASLASRSLTARAVWTTNARNSIPNSV